MCVCARACMLYTALYSYFRVYEKLVSRYFSLQICHLHTLPLYRMVILHSLQPVEKDTSLWSNC